MGYVSAKPDGTSDHAPSDLNRPRWTGGLSRLLTPAEERVLVGKLAAAREKVLRLLKPIVRKAPAGIKLDHFDQIVGYYRSLAKAPAATKRAVDRSLAEYGRTKHALVLANLPWVTKLARAHRQSAIAEEDLFQDGVCGLLKAIDRFEAERGLRLMTYATWYIREAMQQIRARQSHLVSLSAHDQTLLGKIEAQRAAFRQTHERSPTTRELGQSLGADVRTVNRLQTVTSPSVSLERSGVTGPVHVPVEDPVQEFDRKEEITTAIERLLATLPTRERMVVSRRFGLEGYEPTSLEVLGDDLKVSKERVRQLQRQAIKRMQRHASDAHLEPIAV